jgi:anti-sigma factor RsiW
MTMKRCSRVVSLLVDYFERHLPPDVHDDLERHLAACPKCVAHLRTYESTLSLLHSLEEEDLPPELRLTLRAFLHDRRDN